MTPRDGDLGAGPCPAPPNDCTQTGPAPLQAAGSPRTCQRSFCLAAFRGEERASTQVWTCMSVTCRSSRRWGRGLQKRVEGVGGSRSDQEPPPVPAV